MKLSIDDNADRIAKKIQAAKKEFRDMPVETVDQEVEIAEAFAKKIVPYDRGYLYRSLVSRKESAQGTSQVAVLEVEESVLFQHPSNLRRSKPFNYATYMHIHFGNLSRGRIVSGDARFMETTRKFMQERFKTSLRTRMRDALGRFGHGFK